MKPGRKPTSSARTTLRDTTRCATSDGPSVWLVRAAGLGPHVFNMTGIHACTGRGSDAASPYVYTGKRRRHRVEALRGDVDRDLSKPHVKNRQVKSHRAD